MEHGVRTQRHARAVSELQYRVAVRRDSDDIGLRKSLAASENTRGLTGTLEQYHTLRYENVSGLGKRAAARVAQDQGERKAGGHVSTSAVHRGLLLMTPNQLHIRRRNGLGGCTGFSWPITACWSKATTASCVDGMSSAPGVTGAGGALGPVAPGVTGDDGALDPAAPGVTGDGDAPGPVGVVAVSIACSR
jgi:hypothetical protein